MVTETIIEAIETMRSMYKSAEAKMVIDQVEQMLGDFEEDEWLEMSEPEQVNWCSDYVKEDDRDEDEIDWD